MSSAQNRQVLFDILHSLELLVSERNACTAKSTDSVSALGPQIPADAPSKMPIYKFTHCGSLSADQKQELASEVAKIHCERTGAPAKYVQTVFQKVQTGDAYTAGKPNDGYVALEAVIRPGRPEEVEAQILWQLNELVTRVLKPKNWFITLGRFDTPHLIENGELIPAA